MAFTCTRQRIINHTLSLTLVILFSIQSTIVHSSSSSSSTKYQYKPKSSLHKTPISLQSGIFKILQTKWEKAHDLALLEQSVEDYNAEIVATANGEVAALSSRLLIVLPLDERFDPPTGVFSHGHVQTGDKMSLPSNFWASIQKSQAEVPWLFEISRIPSITSPRSPDSIQSTKALVAETNLSSVVGGAIDFRAPPNYIFLPHWMMHALQLRPLDVVSVRAKHDTPPGASVKLRPHSADFVKIRNHQAVLETELKHYSALTKGATIPFDYLGKRFYFDVIDLRSAPRNEKVSMAKVQDCDLVAEFVRSKEEIEQLKEKRRKAMLEKEEEEI